MPKFSILSHDAEEYRRLIENAQLPRLAFSTDPAQSDIVLGEPKQIRDILPQLSALKWAQSIYAGV